MSKYKVEFTLKQHTPMIHFQAKQVGSTLRGSELKPKFDRYLIEELELTYEVKGKRIPKEEYTSWFLGAGVNHLALDYKVKIEDESLEYKDDAGRGEVKYKIYMGNISGDSIYKKMDNEYKKSIEFKSFHTELLKKIEENFSDFMLQTNFGRAQSKGFGSYTVVESESMCFSKNVYKFNVPIKQNIALDYRIEKLYTHIYYFYKLLKSGINEYGKNNTHIFYGKSLLWKYAKEELDATWDKKLIKQHYFNDEFKKHSSKYNNADILSFSSKSNNEYLIRDLLGYANSADWAGTLITKSNENVDRFQSPVRFKPIITDDGYDVYFWGEEIPDQMLDTDFIFNISTSSKPDLPLSTPVEFNIDEYLNFVKTINIENHIDRKFHNTDKESIYQILSNVFNSLEKVDKND